MMTYRFLAVFTGLVVHCALLSAQSLTGIWKGYFITKDQSQYKIEVQINDRNGQLTGVTYSYLDVQFYGKATMAGNFDKKLGKISMQEIKTVEVKSSDSSETCIMNYQLSYSRSGNEEYLEGNYSSKYENNGLETKKGQDCGGGIVFLRRVSSSDFDTKPLATTNPPAAKKIFYNQAPPSKNQGTIPNKSTVSNKSSTAAKPIPNTAPRTAAQNAPKARAVYSNPASTVRKSATADTKQTTGKEEVADGRAAEILKATSEKQAEDDLPAITRSMPEPVENNRQNELVKEIVVSTKQISIAVYDNGEIDGDTVSVYLNGKVILSEKRLSTVPLQLTLTLDEEQDLQELTFVAENLGRIPPNTALMIVDTGRQQYRLQVLSTDKKNAVFRFRFRSTR